MMNPPPPTANQLQFARIASIWLIVAGLWKTVEVFMVGFHALFG